jgi:hypothetical protein
MRHTSKPISVGTRLHIEARQSSAAFKSEVTMSILLIESLRKSVFIRAHPWLNSLFWIPTPANPNPKSTPGYRKSTVDLREELLIWVKNDLQTSLLPACRHSFCPMTTREWNRANKKQAEPNQNRNPLHS